MADFNFKKWNLILGWLAFLIAFITYSLTVEPTVSFWDAGEYILTSSKLQVGHPPGAPFFSDDGGVLFYFRHRPYPNRTHDQYDECYGKCICYFVYVLDDCIAY